MHQHKSGIESALKETKVCELLQMSTGVHLLICVIPIKGEHERKKDPIPALEEFPD